MDVGGGLASAWLNTGSNVLLLPPTLVKVGVGSSALGMRWSGERGCDLLWVWVVVWGP